MLEVKYHGHSCFAFTDGRYNVLIDPFITGNPQAKVTAQDLQPTHLLLTHGHEDHLGDAIEISKRTKALIIAPNELGIYCENNGATVHRMHIGGAKAFDFGWVKLTPAWHGSAVIEGKNIIYTGNPCGFVVRMADKYVYHAGDTGLFGDMKLIGEMYPLDCALLPIGDNYVMGPEDALLAMGMLGAKLNIPMHYNTFPVIAQDPSLFVRKAEEKYPGLKAKVMQPGESIEI
ncbi:MAG: metal-dependent hydrolase [Clostridia bacterium]|jgi:L-ascorbate metabolism protein UlaG (beta-lactamase superfamily)|nr:metal-dependent hydrolase [Clostridia bacterium]